MGLSLITGGAGFIGSNMVRFLLAKGQQVRVLDNFETGKRANLTEVADQIELIEGDIRNMPTAERSVAGADVVYHLAALGSVPRSVAQPGATHDANVTGIFNMLQASRNAQVSRFVFASSSSVYGETTVLPQHEDLPYAPISPYAASKAIGEVYCRAFYETYSLPTICLRYFNVFGPRQDPASQYAAAVPIFITRALRGEPITIFGDGEQTRDFIFVKDIAAANLHLAMEDELSGVYNVAYGGRLTVNDLAAQIVELTGSSSATIHADERPGDVRHSSAAVDRLLDTGFRPQSDFSSGLALTIDYFRGRPAAVG